MQVGTLSWCCTPVTCSWDVFCSAVRVATAAFSQREVVDNIMSAVESAVSHVPKKWKNIQAIHIKAAASAALPVFNSLPSSDTVTPSAQQPSAQQEQAPARKGSKRKTAEVACATVALRLLSAPCSLQVKHLQKMDNHLGTNEHANPQRSLRRRLPAQMVLRLSHPPRSANAQQTALTRLLRPWCQRRRRRLLQQHPRLLASRLPRRQ